MRVNLGSSLIESTPYSYHCDCCTESLRASCTVAKRPIGIDVPLLHGSESTIASGEQFKPHGALLQTLLVELWFCGGYHCG